MRIQEFRDDAIERTALGNLDAWLLDAAAGVGQNDLAKNLHAVREEAELDQVWEKFKENMESGGRTGSGPRLRAERQGDPDEWKIGDDPNLGLGEPLEKIFTGGALLTGTPGTQKIIGDWIYLFGSDGKVRRCHHKNTDPRIFDRVQE